MDPKEQEQKQSNTSEAIAATDPAATTPPAATPAAPPAAAPIETEQDPELVELRQAEADARRELEVAGEVPPASAPGAAATPAAGTAAATPAATPAPATTPSATTPPAAGAAAQPAKKEKFVPLSALAQERAARQRAEARANFEAGKAAALAAVAKAGGQPAQPAEPELTPEEELQEIDAQKLELAAQFDAGKITAKDMTAKQIELDRRAREIEREQHQPAPANAQRDDLTLAERTAQIESKYPAVKNLSDDEASSLVTLAYSQAAREGKPIGKGPAATLELRERVAKLAQTMYGGPQPAATPAASSTPSQPALSPQAQARATKLEAAATHPPDVSTMGSASTGTGPSDSEVEARLAAATTEEEVDAIMRGAPQVINRALGRLAP